MTPLPTTPASRRTVLAGGALSAAALAVPTLAQAAPADQRRAAPALRRDPFTLGIASGDPWPDGFVIWTRLALDPLDESGLGGMPTADYPVRWEVSTDARFRRIVARGTTTARLRDAHSVHVELRGLRPGRDHWYRFRLGRHVSPVGRTRTAPPRDAMPAALAMSFVSCSQYEHGFFSAYRQVAADEPELVLHLGDYTYEYAKDVYVSPTGNVRDHAGPETVDLSTYRQRHAQYKADADLQAAHAVAPWLVVWDDHELDNNWADEVPENDESVPGYIDRRRAAFRAYYENMPLRRGAIPRGIDMKLFRRVAWGRLAMFHMLDTRQFRSDQACGDGYDDCPEADDPTRTLLGADQEAWLLDGFDRSRHRWDLLGQQVFFAQRDNAEAPDSTVVSMDAWDGYRPQRDRVVEGWRRSRVRNPVVLTGDVHAHWASDITADFADPDAPVVGSELVCSSITSGGDGADSAAQAHPWLEWNPHLKFQNNLRGYVRTTITKDAMSADFRCVPRVTVPDEQAFTRATFEIADGEPGLRQTYDRAPGAAGSARRAPTGAGTEAWEYDRP